MENASKALLISAGVLFALIILGLFVILFSNLGIIGRSEEDRIAAKQLKAFNEEYEAYNKKRMYGTDIITVVRKAMGNNSKYGTNMGEDYHIDIEITIIQDFKSETFKETVKENGSIKREDTIYGIPDASSNKNLLKGSTGKYTLLNGHTLSDFFKSEAVDKKTVERTDNNILL